MGCYCFKDNMNIGLYLCNYSGQSLTLFEADMTPSFKNYFFEKNLQLGAPWSLMMFTIIYCLKRWAIMLLMFTSSLPD